MEFNTSAAKIKLLSVCTLPSPVVQRQHRTVTSGRLAGRPHAAPHADGLRVQLNVLPSPS